MDISNYIAEYARKKRFASSLYDATTARNLLIGDSAASLKNQPDYEDLICLPDNIQASVKAYLRNKDIAIRIYKDFLDYLKKKNIDITVDFPPISVSNTFERLMYIAKYLQEPGSQIKDLPDKLWVSERTIEDDIKRLRGNHDDPIQICGKVFKVKDLERNNGSVFFPSTAHPLFLTPNLTQVVVTLKGLKLMAQDPLYTEYAWSVAADIWEQLSDYAKDRVQHVLSELLPEDLAWYEELKKGDEEFFYSEVRCSTKNVVIDCIKNGKPFYAIYEAPSGLCIYEQCRYIPQTYNGVSIEVSCTKGQVLFMLDKVIKSAYTVEELL